MKKPTWRIFKANNTKIRAPWYASFVSEDSAAHYVKTYSEIWLKPNFPIETYFYRNSDNVEREDWIVEFWPAPEENEWGEISL